MYCVIKAHRRGKTFTSSPDEITVENWDSLKLTHGIMSRADVVRDVRSSKRIRNPNRNLNERITTTTTAATSSESTDETKAIDKVPAYRVRGRSRNETKYLNNHHVLVETTTITQNIENNTNRNLRRKPFQSKQKTQTVDHRENSKQEIQSISSRTESNAGITKSSNDAAPANHRQTYSDTPLEVATRKTPTGRRYRIRVVEANSLAGKSIDKNSTESHKPNTTTDKPTDNSNKQSDSAEEPNYPEHFKGKKKV